MNFIALTADDMPGIGKSIRSLGFPVRITAEPHEPGRTAEQNARYWALLTEISQQAPASMDGVWYSPEAWHEHCKRRFLGVEAGPFGEPIAKSTKRIGVKKFGLYMDEIEAWAVTELSVRFSYERAA